MPKFSKKMLKFRRKRMLFLKNYHRGWLQNQRIKYHKFLRIHSTVASFHVGGAQRWTQTTNPHQVKSFILQYRKRFFIQWSEICDFAKCVKCIRHFIGWIFALSLIIYTTYLIISLCFVFFIFYCAIILPSNIDAWCFLGVQRVLIKYALCEYFSRQRL